MTNNKLVKYAKNKINVVAKNIKSKTVWADERGKTKNESDKT